MEEWEEADEPPDEQLPDEVLQRYTGARLTRRLLLFLNRTKLISKERLPNADH